MQEILDDYSAVFEEYLLKEELPDYAQGDVLARYIKEVLDDPGNHHLCTTDVVWKDLLKSSLLEFISQLLPHYQNLEKEEAKEKKFIRNFHQADIKGKRLMWPLVEEHIPEFYAPSDVNLDGYVKLMKNKKHPKELIFDAMVGDWEDACERRIVRERQRLLDKYKHLFKEHFLLAGKEDYKTIRKTADILVKFPVLIEILQMMGREKQKENQEEDCTITRNLPLLLAHSKSKEEIEGIRVGDDLSALVPTEVVWLSDVGTEQLFFQKFASKQLQLFASKPPVIQLEKTEQRREKKPRLQEGPMIVCIDTSASMIGKPERIAKSLTMQILQTAKRKKRNCFLITYSVRASTLDISLPQNWSKAKSFMNEGFTGGTDGEIMLAYVLDALNSKKYSMADVLIISDFEFNLPQMRTRTRVEAEKKKGTRFYGLKIGRERSGYEKFLDRMWVI